MAEIAGNVSAGIAATQNGVAADGSIEWTLPSGRIAKMRRGKGKDVLRASRMVDTQKDGSMAILLAGIAVKTLIDGKPFTYEELLEFDEEDVWSLMQKSQSGKALSPPTI